MKKIWDETKQECLMLIKLYLTFKFQLCVQFGYKMITKTFDKSCICSLMRKSVDDNKLFNFISSFAMLGDTWFLNLSNNWIPCFLCCAAINSQYLQSHSCVFKWHRREDLRNHIHNGNEEQRGQKLVNSNKLRRTCTEVRSNVNKSFLNGI